MGGFAVFARSHLMQVLWLRARFGTGRERGASLVEYALLVALIAVVCIAAVAFFGGRASESFSNVGRSVSQT
jgi:pilus assembly protein Flp/PilA